MKGFIFVALSITTIQFVACFLIYLVDKSRDKTTKGDSDKELCVSCHADTGYKRDLPIDNRLYYAKGQGPLCEKCGEVFSDEYPFDRVR